MRTNRIRKSISVETVLHALALLLCGLYPSAPIHGLPIFDSGSTGADGALVFENPPLARSQHRLVYDSDRQRIVMIGGNFTNPSEEMNVTWEWDGARWYRKDTIPSPTPRLRYGLAYDVTRQRVVLFGGWDPVTEEYRNDTWEYDGDSWTLLAPPQSPSERDGHAMAFHAQTQKVVLFGGQPDPVSHSNETWEWDGSNWSLKTPSTVPPYRSQFSMAYDDLRGEIVMYGGYWGTGGASPGDGRDDLWTWDGANWTQRTSGPFGTRWRYGLAYDPVAHQVLLVGGNSGPTRYNDLWTWNGSIWSQIGASPGPSARNSVAMDYDAARGGFVIFGGDDGGLKNDTWVWNGSEWATPTGPTMPLQVFDMSSRESGIWNFTTIDIPSGVTVQFNRNTSNTPVIWLATGEVNIAGELDLRGESSDGSDVIAPGNERMGGPGGFAGGIGGNSFNTSGTYAGNPGQGPGGGLPGTAPGEIGGSASHATEGGGPRTGSLYGNLLQQPPIGGSGGGGAASTDTQNGYNGAGGGGAILIASSIGINVDGRIDARGGNRAVIAGRSGGAGSGGGIRLVAEQVQGNGSLEAVGGSDGGAGLGVGGNGRIRIEALQTELTGTISPPAIFGPPISTGLQDQATIVITQVAGTGVPANPTGNLASPDVIFTETGSVTVDLQTTHIPVGTDVTVRITASGQELLETATVGSGGSAQATFPMVPAGVGTVQAYAEFPAP